MQGFFGLCLLKAQHTKGCEGFFGRVRRGEFNVPKISARFEDMDRIEETFGFAINFRNDASRHGLDAVAFQRTL